MEVVDIGNGFSTVTFHNGEDRAKILREGPWFINYRFLSIHCWEPNFNPDKAKLTAVAMWIRMPMLPFEYYNPIIIRNAASQVGPLIQMDDFTVMEARANFARLCIQVDFEKALSAFIWIGNWKQAVQYKGFTSIYFECGKIGHKKERYPSVLCATTINHNIVDESMVDGNKKGT